MLTKRLIPYLTLALLAMLSKSALAAPRPTFAPAHSASFEHRHEARAARAPATLTERNVSGVLPRAIRGGNPLQMLNPYAPARYGTAEENVVPDPDLPGQGNGIRLLSISF